MNFFRNTHKAEAESRNSAKPGCSFYMYLFLFCFAILFLPQCLSLIHPPERISLKNKHYTRPLYCPVIVEDKNRRSGDRPVVMMKNLEQLEKDRSNGVVNEFLFSDKLKNQLINSSKSVTGFKYLSLKLLGETETSQTWEVSYLDYYGSQVFFTYTARKNKIYPISKSEIPWLFNAWLLGASLMGSALITWTIGRSAFWLLIYVKRKMFKKNDEIMTVESGHIGDK